MAQGRKPQKLVELAKVQFKCSRYMLTDHASGLVLLLYVEDKGSANTAHVVKTLLRALEVQSITHTPGNARAKGSAENGHKSLERAQLRMSEINNRYTREP